jgi:hypothetical protein
MFFKRSLFNCIIMLALFASLGACTPSAETALPDTLATEPSPSKPVPDESPKIEEPPLPVIASERDHHPYNWQPEDVKGLDPWGDSESDATDLVAIYQRQMEGDFEFRLDILNFEDEQLPPIYFAIDFLEGGGTQVSPGISLAFEIEWDLLVSVIGGEFTLYDPSFTDISDQFVTSEINHQLDFVFFAISETAFAGWDGSLFQIQAMLLNSTNSAILDQTTPVTTVNTTGRAKLVLTFVALFFGNNPSQAAEWYDGYYWGTFGDRPDVRPGEIRGLKYLLDAVERYEIPLNQSDTFFDQFPGGEYIRLNERFRYLAEKGLYEPRMTLGFGHYMPWQPDDVDAKAIEIALDVREKLNLPASEVFYPYEGLLSPGDIQVIKHAGFEAIYAHDQARYSFFGHLEDWSDPAVVRDYFKSMRKIHRFNGMKFVFENWFDLAPDDRWGDWPADEYEWFTGTDQGLHLWWRRILLDLAVNPDQEQFYSFGTDLHFSTWLFPDVAEWNFQWLAGHPWIEVTTFDSIVDRGWEVIDHGELEVPPDQPLWRFEIAGDTYYNIHFPQHYYGGIADGHSPSVPAGVEIEAYYDYIPYLRDGELIPSMRIMGDDKTPGSIIYETLNNMRAAPDNPLTTFAWLSYFNMIGEQTFHEGASLRGYTKSQANLISQVNKVVAAAHWAAEAEGGALASTTQVYEKDLDLDGEMEYVMHNDKVFAIFENDGGRLEHAYAFHPDYGPIVLIAPSILFPFRQGEDFNHGEAVAALEGAGAPDGAFVEDIDLDESFDYEVLTASIDGENLTFNYETRPASKTFSLEGDTISVHYELGSTDNFSLGFSAAVNPMGVFEEDWIWNFEPVNTFEVVGWQMSSGGVVLLNVKDNYNVLTASFFDSPARQEMSQLKDDQNYSEGHFMCFPCSSIKIRDTQDVDFSLRLSAAPIDTSAYTPVPTPTPTLPPPPVAPPPSSEQFDQGYAIYGDDFASGWFLNSWDAGTADQLSSASVYEGSNAIEFTLEPDGGFSFVIGSFDASDYDYLVFYLNGGETADQDLFLRMNSEETDILGEAFILSDGYIEGGSLQPGQWHQVALPLNLVNSKGKSISWFDMGDASGDGASTFYIDEIRFVSTGP